MQTVDFLRLYLFYQFGQKCSFCNISEKRPSQYWKPHWCVCNCNIFLTLNMRKYWFPSLILNMLIYVRAIPKVLIFFSPGYSMLQKMQLSENSFWLVFLKMLFAIFKLEFVSLNCNSNQIIRWVFLSTMTPKFFALIPLDCFDLQIK